MSGSAVKLLTMLSIAGVLVPHAAAQSVISARSGLVHFFEGTVYVAGQPLETQLGRFASIPDGAEVRTEQGRAEILLNPGVFMRIGENTRVRLVDSDIENTRLELLQGSATIDCTQTGTGPSLAVALGQWNVHFLSKGLYRIDAEPPVVHVRTGTAQVASGDQEAVTVERGMSVALKAVLAPEPSPIEAEDALSDWSIGRRQSIMADDAISAQIDQDPASRGDLYAGTPGVSYFPLIGLSGAPSAYAGYYDPYSPYQAGFHSIYLPGYTYRPLLYISAGAYGGMYRGLYSGNSSSPLYGSTPPGTAPGQLRIHIPRPIPPPAHSTIRPAVSSPHSTVSHPIGGGSGHVGRGR